MRVDSTVGKADFPSGFLNPLDLLQSLGLRHPLGNIENNQIGTVNFGAPVFVTGILVVPNALNSGPMALFLARMASNPALDTIFSVGSTFGIQTGELTAATGPANSINFSTTHDGRFVIENRRG